MPVTGDRERLPTLDRVHDLVEPVVEIQPGDLRLRTHTREWYRGVAVATSERTAGRRPASAPPEGGLDADQVSRWCTNGPFGVSR